MSLYFEDVEIGFVADLGAHTFTRDEVLAFAQAYDPQPFHLDEAAAAQSLFGGLSASGAAPRAIPASNWPLSRILAVARARPTSANWFQCPSLMSQLPRR